MVARRIASFAGFVALVVLALMLLWRVYVHHDSAAPYTDEPVIVQLLYTGGTEVVKIANAWS